MRIRKSLIVFLIIIFYYVGNISCSKSSSLQSSDNQFDTTTSQSGVWQKKASLLLGGRAFAVGFSIGGDGYLGTGIDENGTALDGFMKYDTTSDSWTQVASIPNAREKAFAFVINEKAYVGGGIDGSGNTVLGDFYEYDPFLNTWTEKAAVPEQGRYGAVAFSVVGEGYITFGMGSDNSTMLKDMYSYDPTSDQWSEAVSSPAEKRIDANVFVYNNNAYVFGGTNIDGSPCMDFYKFSAPGQWSALNSVSEIIGSSYENYFSDIFRSNASTLVLNDNAYLVGGTNYSGDGNDLLSVWSYNFTADTWTRHPDFTGEGFAGGISFAIGNRGFLGTGLFGLRTSNSTVIDNIYEYDPTTIVKQ